MRYLGGEFRFFLGRCNLGGRTQAWDVEKRTPPYRAYFQDARERERNAIETIAVF